MSKSRTKVTCNFTRMTPFIFPLQLFRVPFRFSLQQTNTNEWRQKEINGKNNELPVESNDVFTIYSLKLTIPFFLFFLSFFATIFFLYCSYVDWVFRVNIWYCQVAMSFRVTHDNIRFLFREWTRFEAQFEFEPDDENIRFCFFMSFCETKKVQFNWEKLSKRTWNIWRLKRCYNALENIKKISGNSFLLLLIFLFPGIFYLKL